MRCRFGHHRAGDGHAVGRYLPGRTADLAAGRWGAGDSKDDCAAKISAEKTKEVSLTEESLRKKRGIFDRCYPGQRYLWRNLTDIMEYEFTRGPEVFTQQSSRANYSSKNTYR